MQIRGPLRPSPIPSRSRRISLDLSHATLACGLLLAAGCTLSDSSASFFQPSDDPRPDTSVLADSAPPAAQPPITYSGPGGCDPKDCDDGLPCTSEACIDGKCQNLLDPNSCLIDGRCLRDGDRAPAGGSALASCEICAPRVSQTVTTFASGMPCNDGQGETIADVCMAGVCRGFHQRSWSASPEHTSTALHGVAYIPRSTAVWAVGRQRLASGAHPGGVILRLDGAKEPTHQQRLPRPLTTLHGNLAVGLSGTALLYSPAEDRWRAAERLSRHLERAAIRSVWTAQQGSTSRYFLATSGAGGTLLECVSDNAGASFGCKRQSGLRGALVRVSGVNSGAASQLWALRGDGRQDIFHGQPLVSAWSDQAPQGCADAVGGTGACVDSPGPFADLWVGSSDVVWAVGHRGLVLRFDGLGWRRVKIGSLGIPSQPAYTFRGVWGTAQLTVLVGERQTAENHELVALFYNAQLDRWYGPQILLSQPNTAAQRDGSMLLDIDGRDASAVYMVGSSVDPAGQQRALILSRKLP